MSGIKNLVLDLGGVIFTIDYRLTIDAFARLGLPHAAQLYSQKSQIETFDLLEKGLITEEEFYNNIRAISHKPVSDQDIRHAWNALLIGVPERNTRTLFELKNNYNLFLLSNTNIIHEKAYREMISEKYGRFFFPEVFEKMYLSHHIHLRKPERAIFDFVIADTGIDPAETLFIDDSIQHVKGAAEAGWNSILFPIDQPLDEFIRAAVSL